MIFIITGITLLKESEILSIFDFCYTCREATMVRVFKTCAYISDKCSRV